MKREGILEPSGVFKSAAHWRMRGEEMRTLADDVLDPVQATMRKMAADYDGLAKCADENEVLDLSLGAAAALPDIVVSEGKLAKPQ